MKFLSDKSSWGEGPWQSEPDELNWQDEATSLTCIILRASTGALCGYVGIPPGHPLFGWDSADKIQARPEFLEGEVDKDVSVIDTLRYALSDDAENDTIPLGMALHVHGGITWSGSLPTHSGLWFFGFDCAHAGDYFPALNTLIKNALLTKNYGPEDLFGTIYRTIDFVKAECARLAAQLRRFEAGHASVTL